MNATPRHIFVDEALATRAYEDTPLPIGSGQTISQPWVVARMTELARAGRALERVLEIGTGCGYQTAMLARIAGEVYTVERIGALVAKARRNLQSLKVKNVRLMHGDGMADLGEDLAVDAIVVTAGTTRVPDVLLKYLKQGGRMVLPLAQHGDERRRRAAAHGHRGDARRPPGAHVRCGKICSVVAGTRLTFLIIDAASTCARLSFHEVVRAAACDGFAAVALIALASPRAPPGSPHRSKTGRRVHLRLRPRPRQRPRRTQRRRRRQKPIGGPRPTL